MKKQLMRSWWVGFVAFMVVIFIVHGVATHQRDLVLMELSQKKQHLQVCYAQALQDREELTLRLQSQTDPAWVEMVLMRDLGLVPQGWLKVQFH